MSARGRQILSILGGGSLFAVLLSFTDWTHLRSAWTTIDIRYLYWALLFYVVTNVVRAYRFHVLFQGRTKQLKAFHFIPEMFLLSFINNTLPARSGELSFPLIMQKRHGIPLQLGFVSLFWARVADFVAVVLLGTIGLLLSDFTQKLWSHIEMIMVVLALGGITFGVALTWLFQKRLLTLIQRIITRVAPFDINLFNIEMFNQEAARRIGAAVLGYSIVQWLLTYAWITSILHSLGESMGYSSVVFSASLAALAKAIPFLSLGNLGAHEMGLGTGLSLTGISISLAFSYSLLVTLITLALSAICTGLVELARFFLLMQNS